MSNLKEKDRFSIILKPANPIEYHSIENIVLNLQNGTKQNIYQEKNLLEPDSGQASHSF